MLLQMQILCHASTAPRGGSNIDINVQCQQLKSDTRFRVILDNLWWVSIVRFLSLKALVGTWM